MKPHKERVQEYVREQCGLKPPHGLPQPVRYDGMRYYWGANDEMIADTVDDDFDGAEVLRIRGWGRIQYLKVKDKTPEQIQDDIAYWIADAINEKIEPSLHHYLAVLEKHTQKAEWKAMPYWFGLDIAGDKARLCAMYGAGVDEHYDYLGVHFSLTTGQPATEDDFRKIANILGI